MAETERNKLRNYKQKMNPTERHLWILSISFFFWKETPQSEVFPTLHFRHQSITDNLPSSTLV